MLKTNINQFLSLKELFGHELVLWQSTIISEVTVIAIKTY